MRYEEWAPTPALAGWVTAYWRVVGSAAAALPGSAVLPDGHIELVINRADSVGLAGPAYTGDQPERAVVGLLSHARRLDYRGEVDTFGIRLHAARGAAFLGLAGPALVDRLQPLAEINRDLDRAIAALATLLDDDARTGLDRALVAQLAVALPADDAIAAIVDRMVDGAAAPTVAELAEELEISARQLQRRFVAAVGIAPKRFARVLRFSRAWQTATMQSPESWADVAADHGYADQAHLIREFREFGALPPTHQFQPEWYSATEIARVSGPAAGVRSVQARKGKPRR